ncbi:MAG: NADH-quinone oxidoreductase subunit J [Clostridia bacterium]|nr:NADH-quinone oxidoreductase subunit J [Clostridia bacterium]
MELNDIKTIVQDAGVVGAGGAGFPTFAKLATGADTLLVNAVECEPLLYTDYTLMHERMPRVLLALGALLESLAAERCLIGIKQAKAADLHLIDGQELAPHIYVKLLPNVYPMGDEINLIYEATGRVVPPGQLPLSVGVIVVNLETVYNVGNALADGTPVTEKWLTISGQVPRVLCVRVPIGARVGELLAKLGVSVPAGYTLLDGGPSMGRIIDPATAIVTKATKGLLVLPDDIPAIYTKKRTTRVQFALAASACCQCTRCTDMCPRNLLGYPLEPHKHVRVENAVAEVLPEQVLGATMCCACGICEIAACCQSISPRAVIAEHKGILTKNKMRYTAREGVKYEASADRAARQMPTSRWMRMLGVEQYDKHPEFLPELMEFSHVEHLTSQHIGAPSIPCVSVGETVEVGQVIATAAQGFSVPQHASIAGKVTYVDPTKIVIEK